MTGLAGNMLRQSGENYFQRGQAFMQQKMGFMSTESLHYYYNLNAEYGAFCTVWWQVVIPCTLPAGLHRYTVHAAHTCTLDGCSSSVQCGRSC